MDRTLYVLDQGLDSLGGHYFEYVRSIAEEALDRGLTCNVACRRGANLPSLEKIAIHPIYSGGVWETLPGNKYVSEQNIRAVSESFFVETEKFLSKHALKPGDVIFLPNIATAHTLATALLAKKYGAVGIHLKFMFRYPRHFYDHAVANEAFRMLESTSKQAFISLWTDSHRLAEDLAPLTSLPFDVVPIPHTDHLTPRLRQEITRDNRLHFVSLGNARGEKGIAEIFDAIRLSAREPWADDARFTLQVNDPYEAEDVISTFRCNPDPRVVLIDEALDTKPYYDLLRDCDAILVPYHRDIYRARTSGIFLEGVLASKLIVCTRDTWMSDILAPHGGGIAVEDRSPASICAAMGQIVCNRDILQKNADLAADYWRTIHSPRNFVAHLLGEPADAVVIPKRLKAAVLYPWGDAISGKSGAAARLRFLVAYLEQHYAEVRVLFASVSPHGDIMATRTFAEPYLHMRFRTKALLKFIRFFTRLLGGNKDEGYQLWYHLWPHIDGKFQSRCGELARWADHTYVEYSYFVPIVKRALVDSEEKFVTVTPYDIVSDQARSVPFIHRITSALEFRALRKADRVVSVSKDDQQAHLNGGINSVLIPHPIDVDSADELFSSEETNAILAKLHDVPIERKRVCFFVGSKYPPNEKAACFVRSIAEKMRGDSEADDIFFLVAGACMDPSRDANFAALGLVDDASLAACYQRADLILVPLTEGTGVSIKSIEALSRGALILSTSIGMRGLDVENGKHCIIEDDMSEYPARILETFEHQERSRSLRAEARAYGGSFDYRVLFAKYLQNLDHLPVQRDLRSSDQKLNERRRAAVLDLLPRIQGIEEEGTRDFFRRSFRLTDDELPKILEKDGRSGNSDLREDGLQGATSDEKTECSCRASDAFSEIRPAEPVQIDSRPMTGDDPPLRHSLLRRAAKHLALLFPPIRSRYQSLLQANSRIGIFRRSSRLTDDELPKILEKDGRSGNSDLREDGLQGATPDEKTEGSCRASDAISEKRPAEPVQIDSRPMTGDDPPLRHSLLRRAAKHLALLFPPIRSLYQSLLQANSRIRILERGLEDAEGRTDTLAGDHRQMESELRRVVDERAATEAHLHKLIQDRDADIRTANERLQNLENERRQWGQDRGRLLAKHEADLGRVMDERAATEAHLHKLIQDRDADIRTANERLQNFENERRQWEQDRGRLLAKHEADLGRVMDERAATEAHLHKLIQDRDADIRTANERLQNLENERHQWGQERAETIERSLGKVEEAVRRSAENVDRFNEFAERDYPISARHLELQMQDVLEHNLAARPLPELNWSLISERRIAVDTDDHRFPRGTKIDNTRHPRFVRACEELFEFPIKHMDLGCAGGGLVWDFTCRGHWSVGVEGSDYSLREQRAYWRTIPDRLFTADIRYPFHFKDREGQQVLFDVISAWELFEHIPEAQITGLLRNVISNLRPMGCLVASIATFLDQDAATGAIYHNTVQSKEWWERRFMRAKLIPVSEMFETGDFVRGSGNPTAHDWDVRSNSQMGFHIVLRYEP